MTLNPKPTLLTAAILCSICFFLGKCTGSEPDFQPDKQAVIDSLNRVNTVLEHEKLCLRSNLDSVATQLDHHDSIRTVYRTRYQTIREIVPIDSADCFELLAQTRSACDSVIASTDSVINDYKAKDSLQGRIIIVQEQQLDGKDQVIDLYHGQVEKSKAELKREKRKRFWVAAGALIVGGGLGAVLGH